MNNDTVIDELLTLGYSLGLLHIDIAHLLCISKQYFSNLVKKRQSLSGHMHGKTLELIDFLKLVHAKYPDLKIKRRYQESITAFTLRRELLVSKLEEILLKHIGEK